MVNVQGHLLLVLGGQKSGKSSYAASRAMAAAQPVVFVAPAAVRDDEFADRVARHRAERPAGWITVETFTLTDAVTDFDGHATVIIDALDTWLAETLIELGVDLDGDGPSIRQRAAAEAEVTRRLDELAVAAHAREGLTVVIAGQPGLGVHAAARGARAYVDLHGIAVQALSHVADEAVLLVAGRPVTLPPPHTPNTTVPQRPRPSRAVPAQLREHGDTQVPAGCVDLAVNVQPGPPEWLATELNERLRELDSYPDDRPARTVAAARHGRSADECAIVAGAAEAFWLLPRVARPRLAACVHPSFTEPEAALRAAGVRIVRVQRDRAVAWRLDPTDVPDAADLVVIGRPDNPTGVLDDPEPIARLCRPGRIVVVDEAFAEFLDDADGLATRRDLPGLVCIRSLTKLWGLPGLRLGYLLGPPPLIADIASARQPWAVSTLALHALQRLVTAEDERRQRAATLADDRADLVAALDEIPGVTSWDAAANFVLVHTDHPDLRTALLRHGLAVRRGDTFPGLDRHHIRVAVRGREVTRQLATALRTELEALRTDRSGSSGMSPGREVER